jgi:hypothetical protein
MRQVAAVIPGASRPSRIAEDSDALNGACGIGRHDSKQRST